jgi:hypothetical protein
MQRLIAAILAVTTVLNGVMMLFAGPSWYANVPGVPETGPFNSHFVQDISAAFLVAGFALATRAWRPAYWPAAVAGAAFLVTHAGDPSRGYPDKLRHVPDRITQPTG